MLENTHRGARAHDHKFESPALCRLCQAGRQASLHRCSIRCGAAGPQPAHLFLITRAARRNPWTPRPHIFEGLTSIPVRRQRPRTPRPPMLQTFASCHPCSPSQPVPCHPADRFNSLMDGARKLRDRELNRVFRLTGGNINQYIIADLLKKWRSSCLRMGMQSADRGTGALGDFLSI